MRLHEAIEGYWLDKRVRLSPRTATDYALTFARLEGFVGADTDIAAITSDDLRRFLGRMQKAHHLSDKSIVNLHIALSSLWTWAVRELGIAHVVRSVTRPKPTAPAIEPFTRSEIALLLAACTQVAGWKARSGYLAKARPRPTALRDRAIILTLLDSGLRAGELTALQLGDLERETGRLHIRHGKGDKSRYVYLGDSARRAIWKYLATRPDLKKRDTLFATASGGALDNAALGRMIAACAQRAGVTHAHPHRFRHTFAITFLRNGGNLLELKEILGHASISTLQIYVKLAQTDLQAASRRASPADHWQL